jgi:hypothetical protein
MVQWFTLASVAHAWFARQTSPMRSCMGREQPQSEVNLSQFNDNCDDHFAKLEFLGE